MQLKVCFDGIEIFRIKILCTVFLKQMKNLQIAWNIHFYVDICFKDMRGHRHNLMQRRENRYA